MLNKLLSGFLLTVGLTGFLSPPSAFAASSEDMVNSLGIRPTSVISHDLFIISDQGGTNTVLPGEDATSAFPQSKSILISNGLGTDKGLGDTDWANDGKYDATTFGVNLQVPTEAKSLVFRTRFTSAEYDADNTGNPDDKATLHVSWTPCGGVGCMTAPIDLIKVSTVSDTINPSILRTIDVSTLDTISLTFAVVDADDGSNDSAIEIMDFHFSEEESIGLTWINEELPPEDVKLPAGTYRYEKSLIYIPGVGLPLDFKIHYNSKQTWSKTFGRKWSHSYEWSLNELENGQIHIRGGDGGSVYFSPDAGSYVNSNGSVVGSFATSWQGVSGSVVRNFFNIDDVYTYTDRNQVVYKFNLQGLLTSITDPNGNTQSFAYWSNKNLKSITDTRGGLLEFFYTNNQTLLVSMIYTDSIGVSDQIEFSYYISSETIDNVRYEYWDLAYFRDFNADTTQFTYDNKGNLLTGTNADGTVFIDNTYASETVVTRKDALGAADSFRFFTDTLEHTNRLGQIFITNFDTQDRPIRKQDPQGNIWTYDYDSKGNLLKETNPLGNVTTMTYGVSGNQLSYTDSLSNTTTQTFNNQNKLTSITAPGGYRTTYDYDASGNLLQETNPLGYVTQYTVDGSGQITSTTNKRGNTSSYLFSPTGDLIEETDPLGHVVDYSYDGMGWLSSLVDERGNASSYLYDQMGQLLTLTDPLGNTTNRTYNARGQVLSLTKANGAVTQYGYDSNGKMTTLTDPLGNTLTSTYNAMEQLVGSMDPLGRTTTFDYDAQGSLVNVINAMGGTASATYDAVGRRTGVTDPNGNETRYLFDALGHVLSETDPLGNTFRNSYDARELLASTESAKGEVITYTYDAAGQLIQSDLPSYAVTYSLDASGNRINTTGKGGASIVSDFDSLDRLVSRTDQFGNTIRYEYGPSGNISELTYSDGKQVHYQYDANDRLISLTDWNGNTTSYSYDAVGHLLTTTHADSTSVTSSYDIAGRLISTSSLASDGSVIFEATYQYNAAGLLASTNTTVPLEPGIKSGAAQFSYDAANQITEMNGQTFAYDANGNMVAGMIGNTAKSIQYDALGRLMTVGQDTYEYGPDGFRVESTIGGKTVRYVQDPNAPYSRLLEEHDENGNIIARYVHGIGLVSRENSSSERSTYHYDSRGSTIALTNSFGQTTDRYAYDPYGKIVGRTGSTPNLFTYNGRDGVVDDGNGLYFMRARYYEPSLMRFIQKDIALSSSLMDTQSLNRHTYVKGNPVQYVDPDGEIVLTTILVGVAVGLATEVLIDWATGEFDPIGGDWGAYWQANKKDLIIAGVAGAIGGGLSQLKHIKRMHKIKKFYKKAGMAMKSFKQWKKVNTIIKYGTKLNALGAAAGTALLNELRHPVQGLLQGLLIGAGIEAGYTTIAEGAGDAGEYLQEKGENFVEGVENAANFTKKKARKVKKFIRSIF